MKIIANFIPVMEPKNELSDLVVRQFNLRKELAEVTKQIKTIVQQINEKGK